MKNYKKSWFSNHPRTYISFGDGANENASSPISFIKTNIPTVTRVNFATS